MPLGWPLGMLALSHAALPPILSLPPPPPTSCSGGSSTWTPSWASSWCGPWGASEEPGGRGGRGPLEGSAALAPTSAPSVALPLQGHPLHHVRPKMLTAPGVTHWGPGALPAAFPKAAQTSTNNPITKLSSWPPLCVCCVFPAGPLNDRHGMGKHTARMHPQAGPE